MFREFHLKPIVPPDGDLQFEWDPETGKFRGRDAPRVQALVDEAARSGSVTGHPHPTVYEITDPAGNASELAVVLGQFWILEGVLAEAYPESIDDAPEGALH